MFEYKAVITRVVDGDTCHANIDLGFDISVNSILRFDGINAPELNTPEGKQAKEFLANLIEGTEVEVIIQGREKYGRWLATVYKGPQNINQLMIDTGHAVEYHGGSRV